MYQNSGRQVSMLEPIKMPQLEYTGHGTMESDPSTNSVARPQSVSVRPISGYNTPEGAMFINMVLRPQSGNRKLSPFGAIPIRATNFLLPHADIQNNL